MFTPAPRATAPSPFDPATKRYYIMGAASLPNGAAFAVPASHRHLLTAFAMGSLSLEEVVAYLTANSPSSPSEATPSS